MKIYTYHMTPGGAPLEAAVAVPEGFSWGAFVFGVFWALYRRLWLVAVIIVGVNVIVPAAVQVLGLSPILASATLIIFSFYIGCSANDWRREKLERSGHIMAGIAVGQDWEDADRRFFDGVAERRRTPQYGAQGWDT